MNRILRTLILMQFSFAASQNTNDSIRSTGFPKFPYLTNVSIPGVPVLGQPFLITGKDNEIRTEKHGLAYPAFFDWNRDGKNDLLIGEFETGETGSYIKVYINEGTVSKPVYSGKYFYATDINGNYITNYQWCCIGIHPKLVDLDGDGFVDILSGQYNPGLISWWRGSKDGFLPQQFVEQEGYADKGSQGQNVAYDEQNPQSDAYWVYSSAGFADFNNDGLQDLFVGGFGELKVALNIGTKVKPKFGLRKYLLGIDGRPLSVVPFNSAKEKEMLKRFEKPHYSGVIKSFITPIDWDGDGVLDLLVTHLYGNPREKDPIVFFRGVKTDKGLRFEKARPLFTSDEREKIFPGCQPNITITDYNNDGVNDLVFGISLPTVNGFEIDSYTAWKYLKENGIESPGKDAGRLVDYGGSLEEVQQKIEKDPGLKSFYLGKLQDNKYLTLRHRGYVYVMLGSKNNKKVKASPLIISKSAFEFPKNEQAQMLGNDNVAYEVISPLLIDLVNSSTIKILFNFKEGWHGYSDSDVNKALGWIPTKVTFKLPEELEANGDLVVPQSYPHGNSEVYQGQNQVFSQGIRIKNSYLKDDKISLKNKTFLITAEIQYQICNEEKCLPPVKETVEMKINFKM